MKLGLKIAFIIVLFVVGMFFVWRGQGLEALLLTGNAVILLLLSWRHLRTAVVFGVLAAAVLLSYVLYSLMTFQAWYVPAPLWILSEKGRRDTNCSQILPPQANENVHKPEPNEAAAISAERALQIGDAVGFSNNAYIPLGYVDGPHLVLATFPDGKERLAWYILSTSFGQPVSGTSSAVYVDAGTGQPLMLMRDIANYGDVQFECGRLTQATNPAYLTLFNLAVAQALFPYFLAGLIFVEFCVYILWR